MGRGGDQGGGHGTPQQILVHKGVQINNAQLITVVGSYFIYYTPHGRQLQEMMMRCHGYKIGVSKHLKSTVGISPKI